MKKLTFAILILTWQGAQFASAAENLQDDIDSKNNSELSTVTSVRVLVAPAETPIAQSGLQCIVNYSNFSDYNAFSTTTGNASSGSQRSTLSKSTSSSYGDGLEAYAVELGYNSLPEQGLGYYVGGFARKSVVQGLNFYEIGFVGGRANLQYAFTRHFFGFVGANVASIVENANVAANTIVTYTPNVSGQVGLGLRFTRRLSLFAEYENLALNLTSTTATSSSNSANSAVTKETLYMGGVTTGLALTF